MILLANNHI